MTDKQSTTEALRGPWIGVLTDDYGFVLDNLNDSDPSDEVRISIRRGSALPNDRDGGLRLPGGCRSGDVIDLWDNLYVEDGDPSTDAAARYAQAQAMAAGLNAAAGMPTLSIERPDDERIEVHVNGQEVATANHDEHGWSGMDAVEKTALGVARAFGAVVSA